MAKTVQMRGGDVGSSRLTPSHRVNCQTGSYKPDMDLGVTITATTTQDKIVFFSLSTVVKVLTSARHYVCTNRGLYS